ncbi:DUF523 domain-containing protein [Streptomyces tendae]|uniref:DUF523 domain-containing protein n=1 Tax=Streptomyces tendae TaxID=1932 RepID=UPI0033D852AE
MSRGGVRTAFGGTSSTTPSAPSRSVRSHARPVFPGRSPGLEESSPSCGSLRVHDGRFAGIRVPGHGVTTALLRRAGVRVFGEDQVAEAAVCLRELESSGPRPVPRRGGRPPGRCARGRRGSCPGGRPGSVSAGAR